MYSRVPLIPNNPFHFMWWSTLPNPLTLLETDNPGWETSNIKYRQLNWFFKILFITAEPMQWLTTARQIEPSGKKLTLFADFLFIFKVLWACFLHQRNTLSHHMPSPAICCRADVWCRLLWQKQRLHMYAQLAETKPTPRHETANGLRGKDIRKN